MGENAFCWCGVPTILYDFWRLKPERSIVDPRLSHHTSSSLQSQHLRPRWLCLAIPVPRPELLTSRVALRRLEHQNDCDESRSARCNRLIIRWKQLFYDRCSADSRCSDGH